MVDSYYTPSYLAKRMLQGEKGIFYSRIADFCVGDGMLLTTAQEMWPTASFFGVDIAEESIRRVKSENATWTVERCDFFSEDERNKVSFLEVGAKFDLILLNPPFSCKGGCYRWVNFDGQKFKASTSLAFLCESLHFMSKNGRLLAILPNGIFHSERDEKLVEYLRVKYNLRIIPQENNNHFHDCSPNISIVKLEICKSYSRKAKRMNITVSGVTGIIRGRKQVYRTENSLAGIPYIHTTHLRDNAIIDTEILCSDLSCAVSGPGVVIPRVGTPSQQKICVILGSQHYIMSDCLICIKTRTRGDATKLYEAIINNWELFVSQYAGTGARYITMKRICSLFNIQHNIYNSNEKSTVS